jgi:glycosyltransferase involved in cell wall biosynthesis
VRPYEFVRTLVDRGHEVTVATVCGNPGEERDLTAFGGNGVDIVAMPLPASRRALNLAVAAAEGVPLQARYSWLPALATRLRQLVGEAAECGRPFDVLHVEHLRGSQFGLSLRRLLPVAWDSVDCITHLFEQAGRHSRSLRGRLFTAIDLGRTRRYEGWLACQFDGVLVTSPSDRDSLEALGEAVAARANGSRPRVEVVPNGVDLTRFTPGAGPRAPDTVLMTGKMSYHANATAACALVDDIMPEVWAERPDAQVVLAGAEPPREVEALARRHPGRVTVTGYVDDLCGQLHHASVAVAPIVYGAGIQNKVLEAMATATPVVATPTAVQALSAEPGRDLLVGEDDSSFARAVLELLADSDRAASIGLAGRAYVTRVHRWSNSVKTLEQVYERAIRRFRERTS